MDKNLVNTEEIKDILSKQPQLSEQSFEVLKGEITPLTFEIMSRQATINIGIMVLNKVQLVMLLMVRQLLSELYREYRLLSIKLKRKETLPIILVMLMLSCINAQNVKDQNVLRHSVLIRKIDLSVKILAVMQSLNYKDIFHL
jgi:hypothetical protein